MSQISTELQQQSQYFQNQINIQYNQLNIFMSTTLEKHSLSQCHYTNLFVHTLTVRFDRMLKKPIIYKIGLQKLTYWIFIESIKMSYQYQKIINPKIKEEFYFKNKAQDVKKLLSNYISRENLQKFKNKPLSLNIPKDFIETIDNTLIKKKNCFSNFQDAIQEIIQMYMKNTQLYFQKSQFYTLLSKVISNVLPVFQASQKDISTLFQYEQQQKLKQELFISPMLTAISYISQVSQCKGMKPAHIWMNISQILYIEASLIFQQKLAQEIIQANQQINRSTLKYKKIIQIQKKNELQLNQIQQQNQYEEINILIIKKLIFTTRSKDIKEILIKQSASDIRFLLKIKKDLFLFLVQLLMTKNLFIELDYLLKNCNLTYYQFVFDEEKNENYDQIQKQLELKDTK